MLHCRGWIRPGPYGPNPTWMVAVLDRDGTVLDSCDPARARILVRDGEAVWILREPATIQLQRAVALGRRRETMPIVNWTEFFKQEHDIYVQNVANAQVSLEFEIAPGVIQGFLFPHGRHPVNITQHIPFNSVKASTNFRKMLNRRPPALQLLSEEEFMKYYEARAKDWRLPDPHAAIDRAEELRQGVAQHAAYTTDEKPEPIHEVVRDDIHLGGKKEVKAHEIVSTDEIINPRVLHICNQVNHEIQERDKMKAANMLEEFETVGQLKLDDYEYIRAHGYWKTVKLWAKQRAAELADSSDEGADEA